MPVIGWHIVFLFKLSFYIKHLQCGAKESNVLLMKLMKLDEVRVMLGIVALKSLP